jgi:hypothetical protein
MKACVVGVVGDDVVEIARDHRLGVVLEHVLPAWRASM